MRKALLHIVLVCALFLNLGTGFAVGFTRVATTAQSVQNERKATIVKDALSESNALFHKNDVINDIDDYDEYDFDSHGPGLTEKISICPITGLIGMLSATDLSRKSFCGTNYTTYNFSRLPRYDYISLRVLRI